MNPSLNQQLKIWKKQQQESTPKKKTQAKQPQNGKTEHLSKLEWEYIMDMHKPKYKRNRGAFKQI